MQQVLACMHAAVCHELLLLPLPLLLLLLLAVLVPSPSDQCN
jgi:hypothetical protein